MTREVEISKVWANGSVEVLIRGAFGEPDRTELLVQGDRLVLAPVSPPYFDDGAHIVVERR